MSLNNFDKNSPEYWNAILEEEWLSDLDKKEWFVTKKISEKFLEIKNILDSNSLKNSVKKIEDEKDIDISLDFWNKKIIFYSRSWSEKIWEIFNSTYKSHKIEHDNHLFLKVEEKFRDEWFWKILFWLHEKMWKEKWVDLIPKKEFSKEKSKIIFSESIWYELKWKIPFWTLNYEDLTEDDYYKIYNWDDSESLGFDVILEKIEE